MRRLGERRFATVIGGLARLAVSIATLAVSVATGSLAAERDRPNIVVILADDLGWGSVGAYGANDALVRTPNIDRIAAEGVLLRDVSTPSSVCSPTRYSLLTGRYGWRSWLKVGTLGYTSPLLLEDDRPTIAALLHDAGYRTAIVGKWHLGFGTRRPVDFRKPLAPGPLERGFDHFFGLVSNHGDRTGVYVEDRSIAGLRSSRVLPAQLRGENFKGRPYIGLDAPLRVDDQVMDVLTERATAWLSKQESDRPFFLFFSAVAVHRPISPADRWKETSAAGPYGDWIHELDGSVGRVLQALEDFGFSDDTLVIFTSDNGGVVERNDKLEATLAASRGLAVNGPYRGGKRSIFEGGFRVPLVARWPDRIAPGSVRDERVTLVDLFATIAEAAELPVAATASATDSISFLAALVGDERQGPTRASLILHSGDGNFAIRWGPWKWIEGKPFARRDPKVFPELPDQHHPQLYNLRNDPAEERNLIEQYPEVARFLSRLLDRHRQAEEGARPGS